MYDIVRVSLRRLKSQTYEGQIVEKFTSLDDPQLELAIVNETHPFPIEFSDAVLAEADALNMDKPGQRVDLTRTLTVTIDGETAKDFDDAISVSEESNGEFNLKVSIADVSFFVREGSALDKEAFRRGTSIYFPSFAVPMLPERLSNGLCSLVPNEDRFTLTCDMTLSAKGEILKSRIYASTIRSAARLTYTQVSQSLDNTGEGSPSTDVSSLLKCAYKLSLIVRKNRMARGGLDLDLPERDFDVDDHGNVTRIYRAERNEAHRLIEDFMILANECVSESIEKKDFPSIFRVHADPDPLKIDRLKRIIKKWGFSLSDSRNMVEALQDYLDSVRGHESEKTLVIACLRSLKQAEYSATNVGHFGLGSESYTHFTSPIRRYPDLMVHRILRNSNFLKSENPPYAEQNLQEISKACSETERRAFLAERDMEDLKMTRYMESHVGEEFEGTITSAKSFGLFVELIPSGVEGLIPTRLLPPDYWQIDELEIELSGRRSGLAFTIGDRIPIKVHDVNRLKKQITFQWIGGRQGSKSESKPNPKRGAKGNFDRDQSGDRGQNRSRGGKRRSR